MSVSATSAVNANGSSGMTIASLRKSSIRAAMSIIAPMPPSYIWMAFLETPAASASVPREMFRAVLMLLSVSPSIRT